MDEENSIHKKEEIKENKKEFKRLTINGKEGPTLKHIFTCEECKWLGPAVFSGYGKHPFHCFSNELIQKYNSNFDLMKGDIGDEMITPEFCPYLIKKMRNEKLKLLYEYRGTQDEITPN